MTSSSIPKRTLEVSLSERTYDIIIGQGLIEQAGKMLSPLMQQSRAFIISDDNVAPLYLNNLLSTLERSGIEAESLVLSAGESMKNFANLELLVDTLLSAKLERTTTLIALGGGVVGDLTGFAASIVLRGVDFVQIPTTLLAQVDSSVGGKTGINTSRGKNLVGSFHQPIAVIADISVLETLPKRECVAGYAEVCKYGLIGDKEFWYWLEENGANIIGGDSAATAHAIETSCAAKARIVAEDERENGVRALLNFGHTFAHAYEAETGYSGALLHGEAVAIGMCAAFALSARLGLCPHDEVKRIHKHFKSVGLPVNVPQNIGISEPDILLSRMKQDKKSHDSKVSFVLTKGIGEAFLTQDVPHDDLRSVIASTIAY